MRGFIKEIDWLNISPMKYWSFVASTSDDTRRETVRNAIFSGEYLGSLKVDGFYQRLIRDDEGNCFMIARSRNTKGEVVDKIEWVPQLQKWMETLPNGTCFLAEAYLPGNEGSKNVTSILGCLKEKALERQKKTPLHFHIFDCMAFDGQNYMTTAYEQRAQHVRHCSMILPPNEFIHFTEFFEGARLWEQLQAYLAEGREGMVIMRKDAIVYTKRTPARVSIKVKKELENTIDCFFTGRAMPATREYTGKEIQTWPYWMNQVTNEKFCDPKGYDLYFAGAPVMPITKGYYNGWAGSLEIGVLKENTEMKTMYTVDNEVCVLEGYQVVPIGWLSGITDEMKANPKAFQFKPIEVTAMELDFTSNPPTLRHGKMKQFRPDLNLTDCLLSKIK